MKRLTSLLAALVAVGGLSLAGAGTANAATAACVGQGVANLTDTLFYPGLGPAKNVGWNIAITTGVCTGGNAAAGTLSGVLGGGVCGQSYSTSGASNDGHTVAYTSAGSMLIIGASPLGNGVSNSVGLANAVPDALAGQSCSTGANHFLVTGVLIGL
jgi:hypothetical protein